MNNMLIGVSGKAHSGKNTLALLFKQLDKSFEIKAFAHKVKLTASILSGIPVELFYDTEFKEGPMPEIWNQFWNMPNGDIGSTTVSVREFLQKIGTDALRNGLDKNVWIKALFADYVATDDLLLEGEVRKVRNEDLIFPNWIIADVRFPNEAAAIKERGGKLIRITRPGHNIISKDHESEIALDSYEEWDYVVVNDGSINELNAQIKLIFNNLKK